MFIGGFSLYCFGELHQSADLNLPRASSSGKWKSGTGVWILANRLLREQNYAASGNFSKVCSHWIVYLDRDKRMVVVHEGRELIIQGRNGDQKAFEELKRDNQRMVH